jgi:Phage tail tube protein, TTP
MAYSFAEGSVFQFSKTFAAAKTITAVTNASPAVATSSAHGYVDNDIVLVESGWEDLNESVVKVDQIDANSFSLLGVNATDTNFFPAGAGTGTAKLVSNWKAMPQVLSISSSGGDPRFTTVQPLAKRNATNIPTGFNAASITITMAYDPANAVYQEMLDISRGLQKVAFRMVLAGGVQALGYGYLSVSEVPQLNNNQVNQVTASFSLLARPVSYSS